MRINQDHKLVDCSGVCYGFVLVSGNLQRSLVADCNLLVLNMCMSTESIEVTSKRESL